MSFDYRKFLAENGLTVGSQLRNQFSEKEEIPQEEPEQQAAPEVDPAKKQKLDKLTKMKDDILAQYKAGKLSLDQYKAKVGNIPQQIQQLRSDIDSEMNPEIPEEEPIDDQQPTDQPQSEELPQEEPAEEENAWNSLQESINQLNKKNMSFDYKKFLEENKLTQCSREKVELINENEELEEWMGKPKRSRHTGRGVGSQQYSNFFYNYDPGRGKRVKGPKISNPDAPTFNNREEAYEALDAATAEKKELEAMKNRMSEEEFEIEMKSINRKLKLITNQIHLMVRESFDYVNFLQENELTVTSRGKSKYTNEAISKHKEAGENSKDGNNYDEELYNDTLGSDKIAKKKTEREIGKVSKIAEPLDYLRKLHHIIFNRYKSGELSQDEYKKEQGDIYRQIEHLEALQFNTMKKGLNVGPSKQIDSDDKIEKSPVKFSNKKEAFAAKDAAAAEKKELESKANKMDKNDYNLKMAQINKKIKQIDNQIAMIVRESI